MTNEEREIFELVYDALKDAEFQLDYCGYGDSYERECARESKLPEKIESALARGAALLEELRARGDT